MSEMELQPGQTDCKLKKICRRKTETAKECWKEDCDGLIHVGCCKLVLDRYSIPAEQRPVIDNNLVFCTKTCFTKWRAQKNREIKAAKKGEEAAKKPRKAPWEQDGSFTVLMDWITMHGNYAAYCGSSGNKGKTKASYYKTIADLIKTKLPQSTRTEKDVENKITSLERQFRQATDWASNTGAGVDNPGDFEAAVLQRCPMFKELEPIMGERPNAKPLSSNEIDSDVDDSSVDEQVAEENNNNNTSATSTATAVEQSNNEDSLLSPSGTTVAAARPTSASSKTSSVTTGSSSSTTKRLISSAAEAPKKKSTKTQSNVDDFIASYMGDAGGDGEDSFHSLRVREVGAREREADARMLEARAQSAKVKKETVILTIEARVKLARERKKLLEDGICTEDDIDNVLPWN